MATIIGSSPNAVASRFLVQEDVGWDFVDWMIIGFPLSMLILVVSWAILLKFYPVGVDTLDLGWVEEERKELGPMSNDEKKVLIIFVGAVAFWIFGERAAEFLLLPLPYLVGFNAPAIPWGLFLIVGAGLSMGDAMILSGTADWLGSGLISATSFLQVLGDPLYLMMLLLVISFVAVALSNFMNNTATAAILIPIMISMSYLPEFAGYGVKIFVLPVAFSMVLSFATPVATPSSTLVYGTGMVSKRELATTGLLISIPAIFITVLFSFLMALFGFV
jgi:sodium-dependent dicarboxylate transporter 2/3/5